VRWLTVRHVHERIGASRAIARTTNSFNNFLRGVPSNEVCVGIRLKRAEQIRFIQRISMKQMQMYNGERVPCPYMKSELQERSLTLGARNEDGFVIIRCDGRIVFREETNRLKDAIDTAFQTNPNVIVDLSGVSRMDCAGLGTLVAAHLEARAKGGWVKCVKPSRQTARLLKLMKLDSVLEVYDSEQQAIDSSRAAAA